jgi:diketogulonate reductase-like aldo/keto reductase
VAWALELGYRSIDTAAAYGNEAGVGRAIRASGVPREKIFVTTKLWNDDQGYDATRRALDASLKRLGLDYVDLYLIHWPGRKSKDSWRAMEELRAEGKARSIGVSNFLPQHLEDLLSIATIVPTVNQIEFHPYLQQPDVLAFCAERNIRVEAWSPLMRGKVVEVPLLKELGAKHGKSPAQVVLRWNLQRGLVTIPKSVRRERLAANADLFDFTLSDDEVQAINRLDRGERMGPDPATFGF